MDRADEILVEVRGLRSVLDALLTALTANEEEGGDPILSLAEALERIGEAVNRQAAAITRLGNEISDLRSRASGRSHEPA